MVTHSRTTLRAHRLRPLNLPQTVKVQVDADGNPLVIAYRKHIRTVAIIRDEWQVNDEWWRDPVARRYVEVISTDGARIVVYEDFIHKGWFLQYTDTSHSSPIIPE